MEQGLELKLDEIAEKARQEYGGGINFKYQVRHAIDEATAELRKQLEISMAVNLDDCETDTNVRNLARPILGSIADDDGYAVTSLEQIVEELISKLAEAEKDKVELVGLCEKILLLYPHLTEIRAAIDAARKDK